MVGLAAVGLLLVAPAAPVPAHPPVPATKADRYKAVEFARIVYQVADPIALRYAKPVEMKELFGAATRGLYEECGLPVPDHVLKALHDAVRATDLIDTLADVRMRLANQPALRGPRALCAAINGFRHATEPGCQLVSPRASTFASVDMDFGVGIELEGVSGTRWMLYQVEYRTAQGYYAPIGWLEPVPQPDAVRAPIGVPWRITRVIPESPAQKAGLKPGDVITHFNGTEVTGENVNKLFAMFAFPPQLIDPQTGFPIAPDRTLTIQRGAGKPFTPNIKGAAYTPASAFGVVRTAGDKWDCLLDRDYKIGYIRIGAVEANLDAKVGALLADLDQTGCRALILDLRWCPGGYLDPGLRIAGMFLPPDAMLAQQKVRNPQLSATPPEVRNTFTDIKRYTTYPMVVLIGNETMGGGELIGAALRDNDRCVLMGQRTVGRASIQNIADGRFGGLQFKLTTGESLRPNGKSRMRKPNSGPTDDWGLRPDEGLEVPVTKDKSAELRQWAELHALRPFNSTEGLDFDDPAQDPYRVKALDYLRKKIGAPGGMK
ncbi:S41 family peptidase [Frigoriglobus tundricola]|uniref:Carboxyl-terminal protease n=1 Tax=Frigoriglobus tundricola TaxID=2774151 RepID=A0A6M5Z2B3_9BACT|nr:S41 family peptidase [Frigoriglobus tundricola]QJX00359.1 Carboxyl-terminal protease [Frigoriglobus tundricola]